MIVHFRYNKNDHKHVYYSSINGEVRC